MSGAVRSRVMAGVAVVLLVAVAGAVGLLRRATLPVGGQEEISFEVAPGMSAAGIADRLEEKGLIRSTVWFRIVAEHRGYARRFKAGTHKLSGLMGLEEIARRLTDNPHPSPDYRVTVIEGLTIREIASVLASEAGIDSASFDAAARDIELVRKLGVDNGTLEGYLYPDTYFVSDGTAAAEMLAVPPGATAAGCD